jgi:PhnB protein
VSERALVDRLDDAIQAMFAAPDAPVDREVEPYLAVAEALRDLPRPSFRLRLKTDLMRSTPMNSTQSARATRQTATAVPAGHRVVTPYLVVEDAPALLDFTARVFEAEEGERAIGSAGGIHAEVRIGDSRVMIGGGHAGHALGSPAMPTALHVYVEDTDAVYQRALAAGATSMGEPVDQVYGERSAAVRDPSGVVWYIATAKGAHHIPPGLHSVNVYLHPLRAEPVIAFMERAFGGTSVEKYASPDGVVHHATVTIGDSVVEMGEAHGPYQPMPTMFYLHVPDVDASYRRALEAGATSMSAPADQPYGSRVAGVTDAFGNQWYLATPLRKDSPSIPS